MNKNNIQLLKDVVNMITDLKPKFYINLSILLLIIWLLYLAIGKEVDCIGICFK